MPGYTRIADYEKEGMVALCHMDADWPQHEMQTMLAVYKTKRNYVFVEDRWNGTSSEQTFERLEDAEMAFGRRSEEIEVQYQRQIATA